MKTAEEVAKPQTQPQETKPVTLGGSTPTRADEVTEYVKALFYGESGAGTYLAGSSTQVPDMSPVLFIDVEGGTKTLSTYFPEAEVVRVKDEYDATGRFVSSAWQHLNVVHEDLRKGVPYRTIVVDSLSEAYELAMAHWMRIAVSRDRDKDPDIPGGDKKGDDSFGRDWTKVRSMLRRMVRDFRDLDANVIFTAHQQEVRDKDGNIIKILPSFPGKLARELAGFVDEMYYIYAKPTMRKNAAGDVEIERRIMCQPHNMYVCKSRAGLPTVLADPTMSKIHAIVTGGNNT